MRSSRVQFYVFDLYIFMYLIYIFTFGDRRSSSDPLCPVVRDVATIEDAISESGTYS